MAIINIPSTGLWGDIADDLNSNFTAVKEFTTVETGVFKDFTVQDPLGLGFSNAITVLFGPGGTTSDGAHTVGSDGVVTVNTSNVEYDMSGEVRAGRTSGAGNAEMLIWVEVSTDGGSVWIPDPTGSPVTFTISSAVEGAIAKGRLGIDAGTPIGTKFRLRVGRQDGTNDSGSLLPTIRSGSFSGVGINDTASAKIKFFKVEVI